MDLKDSINNLNSKVNLTAATQFISEQNNMPWFSENSNINHNLPEKEYIWKVL